MSSSLYASRVVCLTEETTETLYRLGEDDRIVGISGFTVRPARARKEKPKVSAFTSATIDRILDLRPDLVLGFSDLQADIAAALIREGVEVHVFNHRSIDGIFRMMRTVGALVGALDAAEALCGELRVQMTAIQEAAALLPRRPRIYFEEWDEPLITGIQWVSELIAVAGGVDCFAEQARAPLGKDRILADPGQVIAAAPDIIIGSWCGKRFAPERVVARAGWQALPAVRNGFVEEIKSPMILQPGPAALSDGLAALHAIIRRWSNEVGQ
ncbi:MAG: cobalamin-binding protein [Algiphilus sp.]|uniref:cobalamin-binding protein n=1 Tax=Algiphilus sp. TaxID=1872431 RepID=UPI0032EF7B6E